MTEMDLYEELVALRRSGAKAVVATIVSAHGSAPRKAGSKMVIKADGTILGSVGGGALEGRVCSEAMKMMDSGEPRLLNFDLSNEDATKEGMICGGRVDVFLEPMQGQETLVVFGAGHISYFLGRIGKMIGLRLIIVDDRAEFANPERFPEADEIIATDLESAKRRLAITPATYIVIVTRGHLNDSKILEWAAGTVAAYVGMIGSKKKVNDVFNLLKSHGIPEQQLSRVHAPIGLQIGAQTPEEIAVSIMAEIIQVRRK